MSNDTKPSAKDVLLKLTENEAVELFQDCDRAFATVGLGKGGRATMPVRGRDFRTWLACLYYVAEERGISEQALREVVSTLEAKAFLGGRRHRVFTRVGRPPARRVTHLDLADEKWRAVEVGPGGWHVAVESDSRFRRPRGMKALPIPARGGELGELTKFLNVKDEDLLLVLAWLLMAMRPDGPYPVLCLRGEQGSAKSTLARVLRALVDPNRAPLRTLPRDERDLFITATNSWVIALDNVSELPPWLSDALCRLTNGGGFSTRELYSDDEETIFDAMRPVILTGIGDFANNSDLRDRAIILDLPRIEEGKRQTERAFWQEFDAAASRLLGALLDVMVKAVREVAEVHLDRLPRMADFAQWGVAVERALGHKEGSFLKAYGSNMEEANAATLENAPIVAPLLALLKERGADGWDGACVDLLCNLTARAGYEGKKAPPGWPQTSKALSNILHRLAPNLRKQGVEVEKPSGSHKRGRRWRLRMSGQNKESGDETVPTVPSVPPAEGGQTVGGAGECEIPW